MALTVAQVFDDLQRKLGIMPGDVAPDGAYEDIVQAVNWALQTMQKAGAEYFTREALSVTLVNGQAEYALATTTQSVLGPVRTATGRLLRKIEDFGDVANFGLLYLGQVSTPMGSGSPLAFHVRDTRTNADNPHLTTLHVVPAPDATAVAAHSPVLVDVVKTCSSYTVDTIRGAGNIQVADGYAESLFLPLARLQITRSNLFSQAENLARIQEDAALALQTLGIEPQPKASGRKAAK